jgi:hypothetical protein
VTVAVLAAVRHAGRVVRHRDADHVLERPRAELAAALLVDHARVRREDDLGAAEHQHPRRLGELAVEADHDADAHRPAGRVELADAEMVPRGHRLLGAEVARVDLGVGEDDLAVAVDHGGRVARRTVPALQVGDDDGHPKLTRQRAEVGDERAVSRRRQRLGSGERVADLPHLREQSEVGPERGRLPAGALTVSERARRIGAAALQLQDRDVQ